MEKKDLIAHSPVRFFDNATSAALKDGEMGLVTAKKGLGKTSILVQFGIDALLNDKALVHVSFDQQSSNVIAWYSSVMAEIAKKKNFNLDEVSEEIVVPPSLRALSVFTTFGSVNVSWLKFKIVRFRTISSFTSSRLRLFFFAISERTLEYHAITLEDCWSKET